MAKLKFDARALEISKMLEMHRIVAKAAAGARSSSAGNRAANSTASIVGNLRGKTKPSSPVEATVNEGFTPFLSESTFTPFSKTVQEASASQSSPRMTDDDMYERFIPSPLKQKPKAKQASPKATPKPKAPALSISAVNSSSTRGAPFMPNSPAANVNLNPGTGKIPKSSPVAAAVEMPSIDIAGGQTAKKLGVKVSKTNHLDETVKMNMDIEGMRVNPDGTFHADDVMLRKQRVIEDMFEVGGEEKGKLLRQSIYMGEAVQKGQNPFNVRTSSGTPASEGETIMSRVAKGGYDDLNADEQLYFNLTRAFAAEAGVKAGDNPAEILQKVTPILSKGDRGASIDFAQEGSRVTLTHTPPNPNGNGGKGKSSSTKATNPVSSEKAGYEGIGATSGGSGADLLATYGASAGLGAAVTTVSEGEVSPSGIARGAMFGLGGGMALRGVGASLGTGTLNAIGRAGGNRLSQMENEMASDAGKQIVKGLDAMSSSASAQTQAARMATLAGAGLTGFAMSRDRNHSRGLNSTRGSRF